MKNLWMVFLLIALGAINANGQVGPVFPYTSPSKDALTSLAKEESIKGLTYKRYLIRTINIGLKDTNLVVSDKNIDWIFSQIFLEEVNLEQGMFKNSGYDPTANEMHSSLGHKLGWGFQWVFRIGTFTIVIIKSDCGNILEVPVIRTKVVQVLSPQTPPQDLTDHFVPAEKDQVQYEYTKINKTQEDYIPPKLNLNSFKPVRVKTWFGRNWPYFAGTLAASGVTTYLLLKNQGGKLIEPRTMPPGIPSTPTPGGVPADPRNMPRGTGMTFGAGFSFRF